MTHSCVHSSILSVTLVMCALLPTGCSSGSGPATEFLNAYEKAVRTYEAKAAGGGRITLSDINSMNANAAQMAQKAEQFINAKQGGMSSAERTRYMALSARFSEALAALSQKMAVSP